MTTITGTLLDATGSGVVGVTVTARLVATATTLTAGGEIIRSASTVTIAGGAWSLTLTPIASLAYPTGAYYRVEADSRRWHITVPATGSHQIQTVLVTTPEERDETGLTQTAGDARYLGLAGGTMTGPIVLSGAPAADLHAATKGYVDAAATGGAASGTVVAETSYGQASSAGAASAYARGDHTHGTPGLGTTSTTAAAGDDARILGAQQRSTLTAKGDLYAATASGVVDRLPAGVSGQLLVPDASVAAGLKWETQDRGDPQAARVGLAIATIDLAAVVADFALNAGVAAFVLVRVRAPVTITKLGAWVTVAGVTSSGANTMAIYSEAGARLGITGDMTAALGGTGYVEGDLTASLDLAAGSYYLHLLTHFSGTAPKVAACTSTAFDRIAILGHYPTVYLSGQATSPATVTPSAATVNTVEYYLGAR